MKLRSFAFAALLWAALSVSSSFAQVGVSIAVAPPVLPVVEQPPCPVEGYMWTPGYWAYSDVGYYWAPGFWAQPPEVGLLWTPPYWGFADGFYLFHEGYWGPHVGFYGGINYGYGYFGSGYWGGRWEGNVFRYNTAVTRVNTTVIHNTFVDRAPLSKQVKGSRASFNGPGGVKAEATAEEKAAASGRHVPATSQQVSRQEAASRNRDLRASVNHGHPKPAAIKSLEHGGQVAKAEHGVAAKPEVAANKSELKADNTPKAESGRKAEESSSAERHRETMRSAQNREAEARDRRASERENARRAMNERSRRADVVQPRQTARANHPETPAEQQRKRKPAKPNQERDDRR